MTYANDSARDAYRTIAGFVFQVNSTIFHWLNLEPGTFLELESGEDIDIVRAEANDPDENIERMLIQLKQLSDGSLTLRNRDALKSVANFCGHREANPTWKLAFRFITTLPVGEEKEGWTLSLVCDCNLGTHPQERSPGRRTAHRHRSLTHISSPLREAYGLVPRDMGQP